MLCGTAQVETILSTTAARAAIRDWVPRASARSRRTSGAVKGLVPLGALLPPSPNTTKFIMSAYSAITDNQELADMK